MSVDSPFESTQFPSAQLVRLSILALFATGFLLVTAFLSVVGVLSGLELQMASLLVLPVFVLTVTRLLMDLRA